MKSKDLFTIGAVAFLAAIVSFILAGVVFKPVEGSTKVPVVTAIDSTFPDVRNDSKYNSFFNNQALDPTQNVQIGNQNNTDPFR